MITPPRPPHLDAPPAKEQAAAYQYLKDNEAAVACSVLDAIYDDYPRLRDMYGAVGMPANPDLRKLIGLAIVHVLDIAKDGHAYIGFELGCAWDQEHGLGVLTHRQRVLIVGQADRSFGVWPARKDGGQAIAW